MKDSFNTIINLDFNKFNDNTFKEALAYFFTLTDLKLKEEFLEKYKLAVKYYLPVLLSKVEKYPVSFSYDKDVYKIDRLLFFMYSLYGTDDFNLFNTNSTIKEDDSIYSECLSRYKYLVSSDLINDKVLLANLNIYNKEKEIKEKYSKIDKVILEEAYNLYFTLDNFLEKENYQKKKIEFIKKHKIYGDILKDYVRAYGFIYLNIPIEETNQKIRSIGATVNRVSNNTSGLESSIYYILHNNDIKDIVIKYHITPYIVKLVANEYTISNEEAIYISNKVNNAIKELEKEYKYIHYSVAFSKLENTDDKEEIKQIVLNNNDLLTITNLKYFLTTYRIALSKKEQNKLKELLLEKIQMARDEIKLDRKEIKEKNKERDIELLLEKIDFNTFLNKEIKTVNDFCSIMEITNDTFNKCLLYLKEHDNELYLKIKNKLYDSKKRDYKILVNKINKIVDEIINGVKLEDGSKRSFEILDYFLSTKLDFKDFIDIYIKANPNINNKQLKDIKTFFSKNKLTTKVNITTEINGTNILIIENNPYEVKKQEKYETINYLKRNNIPLYTKVYSQALRRHIVGNLIEEEKTFTKH